MITTREKIGLAIIFLFCYSRFAELQLLNEKLSFADSTLSDAPPEKESLLARQVRVTREFQEQIQKSQTPKDCSTARILVMKEARPYDGFALEVRFMSFFLQIAVATERVLIVNHKLVSAYAPECDIVISPTPSPKQTTAPSTATTTVTTTSGTKLAKKSIQQKKKRAAKQPNTKQKLPVGRLICLWNPTSNCTASENIGGNVTEDELPEPLGFGHASDWSYLFDTKHFGRERIIPLDNQIHRNEEARVSHVVIWERLYGRFWVRAQISDYFWRNHATKALKTMIDSRLPHNLLGLNEPFIGFHIRKTDNMFHLLSDFGRNATLTRSFERFMGIANKIRTDHPTLKHIFVATDNKDSAAEALGNDYPDWTFHIQDDVKRGNDDAELMWFEFERFGTAGAIGSDIETLRRADFLVGSFQSNVYRLATELNAVYHADRYPWDKNRFHSVDLEWYEDP